MTFTNAFMHMCIDTKLGHAALQHLFHAPAFQYLPLPSPLWPQHEGYYHSTCSGLSPFHKKDLGMTCNFKTPTKVSSFMVSNPRELPSIKNGSRLIKDL